MPSPFDTLMADADKDIFSQFGVDATYTNGLSEQVSCTVVIDETVELIDNDYGRVVNKVIAISLLRVDVDSPAQGDTIEMWDKIYIVEGELRRDSGIVTVGVRHG